MRRKQFKLSAEVELLLAFGGLILLVLFFASCNPVKKVLKSPAYFNTIKDSVIKRGYCLNDTIYTHSTDTLEVHDTTTMVYVDTLVINDSVVFWETKYHTITKTRTIRDTIKATVVDSSLVGVIRKELWLEKQKNIDNKSWKKMFMWAIGASVAFFLLLFKLK